MQETVTSSGGIERRLFVTGVLLTIFAGVLCWAVVGFRHGVSCMIGGALAAAGLGWLRHTVGAVLAPHQKPPISRFLASYILRLMLIPLGLYAMLRLHFFSLPAAVAGLAAFNMAVLVEGIRQAVGGRS